MNQTSSSSNDGPPRRVSVRHRGATANTATSSMADAAILQFVESRRLRKAGGEPRPRRSWAALLPAGASARPAFRWPRIPRALAVTVASLVGLVVVGTVFSRMAGGRTVAGQPLQGRLVFEKAIPAGAQIRLLPRSTTLPDQAVPRAVVREDGTFAFGAKNGVPPGEYVAVVRWFREAADGSGGRNVLPSLYASSNTSPLAVTVTDGPNAPLDLVIRGRSPGTPQN